MYIYEPIEKLYYKIFDTSEFKQYLDTMTLQDIKTLFKSTYLEQLLNDTYDELINSGYMKNDGEHVNLKDTVIFFKNYFWIRFGEDIYKIVIRNFEANFDYSLVIAADKYKSKLN